MSDISNTQGYTVGDHALSDSVAATWTEHQGNTGPVVTQVDSLTYDVRGWLTGAKHMTGGALTQNETFAFDAAGNLLGNSRAYDATTNRLTSDATCSSYTYDNSGNLTAKSCGGVTWSFTYDALERLTAASNSSGLSAYYTYNVLGERTAKKVNGTVTRFSWRSGHVIFEMDGGGTITQSYVWGMSDDDLVAIHAGSTHVYVTQDKLRSVRGLTDRSGNWYASYRYRAYGSVLDSAISSVPVALRFQWAGAQYDAETHLYFMRSRMYDPSLGRFIQEDKAGFGGGPNLYAFTANPTVSRDPGGTMASYDVQYQSRYIEGIGTQDGPSTWDETDGFTDHSGGGSSDGFDRSIDDLMAENDKNISAQHLIVEGVDANGNVLATLNITVAIIVIASTVGCLRRWLGRPWH